MRESAQYGPQSRQTETRTRGSETMEYFADHATDKNTFNHKNGKKCRPFSGAKYKPASITKGRAVENKIDINKALFS